MPGDPASTLAACVAALLLVLAARPPQAVGDAVACVIPLLLVLSRRAELRGHTRHGVRGKH